MWQKLFTGPPRLPKDHPLSRNIEVYRQARDVEQDPAVRQAMCMQMVDLIRQHQFLLFDLRAEYFVDHRKVDRFRGQNKVKAIKTSGGIVLTEEDEMREGVAKFYDLLFTDSEDPILPKWVRQTWGPETLELLPKKLDSPLIRK